MNPSPLAANVEGLLMQKLNQFFNNRVFINIHELSTELARNCITISTRFVLKSVDMHKNKYLMAFFSNATNPDDSYEKLSNLEEQYPFVFIIMISYLNSWRAYALLPKIFILDSQSKESFPNFFRNNLVPNQYKSLLTNDKDQKSTKTADQSINPNNNEVPKDDNNKTSQNNDKTPQNNNIPSQNKKITPQNNNLMPQNNITPQNNNITSQSNPIQPVQKPPAPELKSNPVNHANLNVIMQLIVESLAALATDDKPWISIVSSKKYIEEYCEQKTKFVDRHYNMALNLLIQRKLVVQKKLSIAFVCAKTYQIVKQEQIKPKKVKTKTPPEPSKNLGPDVIITKSGRVSVKKV